MRSSEVYLYTVITLWTLWFLYYFDFTVWLWRRYERICNTIQLWVTRMSEIPDWLLRTYERTKNAAQLWLFQLYEVSNWVSRIRDRIHNSVRLWIIHAFATGGYIRERCQARLQGVLNVLSSPRDECRKPGDYLNGAMVPEHRDGEGEVKVEDLVSAGEGAASIENATPPGSWVA